MRKCHLIWNAAYSVTTTMLLINKWFSELTLCNGKRQICLMPSPVVCKISYMRISFLTSILACVIYKALKLQAFNILWLFIGKHQKMPEKTFSTNSEKHADMIEHFSSFYAWSKPGCKCNSACKWKQLFSFHLQWISESPREFCILRSNKVSLCIRLSRNYFLLKDNVQKRT